MSAQTSLQAAFETLHGDGVFSPPALFAVTAGLQDKMVFFSHFLVKMLLKSKHLFMSYRSIYNPKYIKSTRSFKISTSN